MDLENNNFAVQMKNITKKFGDFTANDNIDLDIKKGEDITVGMQQRIEIIKALYRGADILIFDEPTAVLTPQEIDEFVDIIKSLSDQGKTIILITHKLKEIKAMADRCTIIRRGKKIDTVDVNSVSESELADMMVGRSVNLTVNKEDREPGDVVLSISNLIVKDARKINKVNGLNLDLKAGEIHGIAGVDGNGQSELLEALSGLRYIESGSITINGKDITNHTPKEIHDNGIYNIPEDRQRRGLVLDFSVEDNLILENFHSEPFSKKGILNRKKINEHATELMEKFDIRPREPKYLAGSLSGGNQQKVIIAREITNNPTVLIAAQPTRGLDVGAIEYVHDYLIKQRDSGKAVLLISFELDEIMGLSDRISVIYGGKILKTLDPKNTDEKEIGLLMAGGNRNE